MPPSAATSATSSLMPSMSWALLAAPRSFWRMMATIGRALMTSEARITPMASAMSAVRALGGLEELGD